MEQIGLANGSLQCIAVARIPTKTVEELPHWVFEECSSAIRESTGRMIGCGVLSYSCCRLCPDVAVLRIEAIERYFIEALIPYVV
jgi:hypothetical protein